jgi:branched-chain amino acid transport system permease protein
MGSFALSDILQLLVPALTDGCVYAVVGLCFMIIYRTTHILNFAQGEFVMLGGILMITFTRFLPSSSILCFFLTVLSVALMGLLVERLGNRVFVRRNASLFVQSFATIGISMIIQTIVLLAYGQDPMALKPFSGDSPILFLGAPILPQSLWVIGLALLMVLGIKIYFDFTKMGKAMRACADSPLGALVVGIEKARMTQCSFALGAAASAVIGVAVTPIYYTGYWTGTLFTVKGFIAAVLGGMYNPFGAVLGGIALGLLENLGAAFISSGYKDIISLSVLVAILLFRRVQRPGMEAH